MSYGELKIDTITFTAGGVDTSVSVSGLVQNPTFTGNITTTGTISGDVIKGNTISGVNVIGTTEVSGATVTGDVGLFGTITGGIHTLTSGVFASGTAANPSITFVGDLDSGIYSSAANEVAISTNGEGRLLIDSDGNVGIGATSPGALLEVADTSGGDPEIFITSSTTGQSTLALGDTTNKFVQQIVSDHSDNSLRFHVAGGSKATGERVRITSNGNVGIGTNSVSAGLHVVRDVNPVLQLDRGTANSTNANLYYNGTLTGQLTAASADFQISAAGASTPMSFYVNGSQRAAIDTSGNVGIGTTSPGVKLEVAGSEAEIRLRDTRVDDAGYWGFKSELSVGERKLFIQDDGANRITIDSSGNVGIGTTSPTRLLTVQSTGNANFCIKSANTGVSQCMFGDSDSDVAGNIAYRHSDNAMAFEVNGAERARIDSSGRLLVGTSTSSVNTTLVLNGSSGGAGNPGIIYLQRNEAAPASDSVLGRIYFANNAGNTGAVITSARDGGTWTSGSSHPGRLVFGTTADGATSTTERMRITNGGLLKATTSTQTSRYTNTANHAIVNDTTSQWTLALNHTAASPYGIVIEYIGTSPNGTTNGFLECKDASATRFYARSNGGLANYQSNDANLCDEREKKNIETLDSTWDCLKNWELKKFHYNEDADTDDKRYGVIAQQVAPHCPEVITDWVKQKSADAVLDDDGNVVTPAVEEIVRMGVKEQQMYWMAIKALQEAQTRIETLEAKVAALEAQ